MQEKILAGLVLALVLGVALFLCRKLLPNGSVRTGCCPNVSAVRVIEERIQEEQNQKAQAQQNQAQQSQAQQSQAQQSQAQQNQAQPTEKPATKYSSP